MSVPLLFLLLSPLVYGLAGPARTHRRVQPASPSFQSFMGQVPGCAFSCIVGFAATSFPNCSLYDLDCQCQSVSQSGFTIGEGALRCAVSDCPGEPTTLYEDLYQMCAGIPGSQPQTHGTISATMASPSTIRLPNPAAATNGAQTTSPSHPNHSSTTRHSSHRSTSPTPTSSPKAAVSAASSAAPTEQSAADAAHAIPSLNKAQIAGIVVSSIVIGCVVIGLLLCVFCSRRKNKRRDSDASFGIVGETRDAPRTPRSEPPPTPQPPRRPLTFLGMPSNPKQKRWTLWRMAMRKHGGEPPLPTATEQYGPSTFAALPYETSPMSTKSYHTTSNLLPDKPSFNSRFPLPIAASFGAAPPVNDTNFPPMPVAAAASKSPRAPTTDPPSRKPVRFANEVGLRMITPTPPSSSSNSQSSTQPPAWQANNTSQSALQRPPLRKQPSDPFLDAAYAEDGLPVALLPHRASNRNLPKLETAGDRVMPAHDKALLPGLYPPGPYPLQALPRPQNHADRFIQAHVSPTPSPNATNVEDPFTVLAPGAAPSDETKFSKWAPIPSQNQANVRPLTHYTNGSDTSFEDEDATPGMSNGGVGTLSPVVESPHGPAEQGKQIYYPPVPGTAASSKELRVTQPTLQDGSPQRIPPPRSELRPNTSAVQALGPAIGSGLRTRDSAPPTRIPQPQTTTSARTNDPPPPTTNPPALSHSPSKASRTPPSPSSPNFSRPQRPEEYRAATSGARHPSDDGDTLGPVARQQRVRQREEMLWRQREERERYERAAMAEQRAREQEAWQRRQAPNGRRGNGSGYGPNYGGNGYGNYGNYGYVNENGFGASYGPPRGPSRRSQGWGAAPDMQPTLRGPWRGRDAPIGAQWRR